MELVLGWGPEAASEWCPPALSCIELCGVSFIVVIVWRCGRGGAPREVHAGHHAVAVTNIQQNCVNCFPTFHNNSYLGF